MALFAAITEEQRPEVSGTAFNRLEVMTSSHTWVLQKQIAAIIMKLVEDESKLKRLMLNDLTFDEFGGLDPILLRQARHKIGEFFSEYDTVPEYEEEDDGDEYDEEC